MLEFETRQKKNNPQKLQVDMGEIYLGKREASGKAEEIQEYNRIIPNVFQITLIL